MRLSGGVEQTERLCDVDFERAERIGDGVWDPGPCRQMDDRVDASNRFGDGHSVGKGSPEQVVRDVAEVRQPAEREIIEDSDAVAPLDEHAHERRADEAGTSGDKNGSVQRRCAPTPAPTRALASGAQRMF
jgi:hypothetical protein